jgi:hypothetical protein
MAVVLETS